MEITKTNDMFAAVLQNADVDVFDLASSNIVPENTQLLPLDEYKNSDKVKALFIDKKGNFDELNFMNSYKRASDLYLQLDTDKTLANALEYDPNDYTAPSDSKKIRVNPVAVDDFNPYKSWYGLTSINSVDDNDLSLRELAQQGKIFDYEKKEWKDKSANDLGWFGSMTSDTLVYAQWEEDGISIDPITSRTTSHKKGDWKYDKNGSLYVETLGDREIYGKQIVNPKDLLTKEGTWVNNIDFFDSDGKHKSVIGTTTKLAAEIAPLLIPGFNVYYGGFKMAEGLASVLPTFYKAAEGLFLGDNESGVETDMWNKMNKLEGFMSKYTDRSTSDAAKQSMANYEQLGNLVTDVFTQIYEQRAAASLAKVFIKTDNTAHLKKLVNTSNDLLKDAAYKNVLKSPEEAKKIAEIAIGKVAGIREMASKQSALAKKLSLGYMALTQSADVYGEALESGYDRRAAGFTSLLAASGQYALMTNNAMGTWFLDKTTGYTEGVSKSQMTKIARGLLDDVQKATKNLDVDQALAKNQFGNILKKFKTKVNDLIVNPVPSNILVEKLYQNAIIEGVEEVTEELAIDAAKGITDVLGSLGYTARQGSFGGFNNVFSKEGLQRYMMSAVGGALGGSMFELERSVISPLIAGNNISPATKTEIYDLVSNGRTKELIETLEKNKSRYGSTTLSPVAADVNGEKIFLPTDNTTQADVIAKQAIEYVKHIDRIVNLENLGNSDQDLIKKSILDQLYIRDLKKSGVDKFLLSDLKQVGEDIVSLNEAIQATSENKEEEETDSNEKLSLLKSQLNDKRKEYTDITNGEKSEYYHKLSLFSLNKELHKPFLNLTVDEYVKQKYEKDFYSLSEEEKNTMSKEFKDILSNEGDFKTKMKLMFEFFLKINEDFSKEIADYDSDGYASVRSKFYNILHNIEDPQNPGTEGKVPLVKALDRLNEVNRTLKSRDLRTHTLDSQTDISVGSFLVNSGLIELTPDNAELFEIYKDYYENVGKVLKISKQENETEQEFAERLRTEVDLRTKSPDQTFSGEEQVSLKEIIEKRNEQLSKTKPVTEDKKDILIKQLDRIGMPSTTFDLGALQEQIDIFLQEEMDAFNKYRENINAKVIDPKERKEELLKYQLRKSVFPNFKVKGREGQQVNARLALLVTYGNQVIDSGNSLDNELIVELNKEKDKLETLLLTAYQDEDAEAIEEDIAKIDKILNYGNRKINSLYDKLKKFEFELFGWSGPVSMFKVLQDNIDKFNEIVNSAEFKRTDVEIEQINKSLYIIDTVKSIIAAMSSNELTPGNLYGFNVSLNKALEKEGQDSKYEIIDSETTVNILKDLNIVRDKLNYFKKLASNNSTTIPENQMKIQKAMITGITQQSLNKNDNLSLANLTINDKPLISSDDLKRFENIENEELKLIEIENTFYNNFHKLEGSLKSKLDSLFESFIEDNSKTKTLKNLTRSLDSNLNADFKKLDLFDWYQHVHYILSYNSNNFYIDYEKALKKELSLQNKKSPFFTQQYALRQSLAYFTNKEVTSHIVDFLQPNIEQSVDLSEVESVAEGIEKIRKVLSKSEDFVISNVVGIRGSGGTGKSSVLGNLALRIILDNKIIGEAIEITALAPNADTLKVLEKDIKGEISNDINTLTKDKFLNKILTADGVTFFENVISILEKNDFSVKLNDVNNKGAFIDPSYFIIGEGDGAVLITEKFYRDFLLEPEEKASPRVLVVDEMSKFTTLEWQLLNKISSPTKSSERKYDNYYTIMLGDELQNGVIINKTNFSLDNILFPSTVKLKNPIRSKNVHQNMNNITLENFTNNWKQVQYYGKENYTSDLKLSYYQKEGDYLAGTKFAEITSAEMLEAEIRNLNPDKQIAVITENNKIPGLLEQALREVFGKNAEGTNIFGTKEIEVFGKDVQGREFDQVIILTDVKQPIKYFEAKDLYTLLSRAKEATLMLGKTNFKVINELSQYNTEFKMEDNIILASLQERQKILEEYTKNLTRTENTSKTEPKKDKIEEDTLNLEENQEDEGLEHQDPFVDKVDYENNAMGYSFYNNIGVLGQEILEYTDYTIGTIDDDVNKQITWETLKERLEDNILSTDLFSLPISSIVNKKLFEVINEYITFKNHLLFDYPLNTLFGETYDYDQLMIKRLDKYSPSYGKLVKTKKLDQPIYVLGRYITLEASDKKVFVTMATMPDQNNQNVIKAINIDKLLDIYKEVDQADNNEILANSDAVNLKYMGVQVPRHEDGTTKINPIDVSNIPRNFPGVTVSEIKVFRDDIDYIEEQFKKYETSEIANEKRDWSKYRFRPYVTISYIEGNVKYSKLIVLQAKSRSFNDFWNQFVSIQESGTEKSNNLDKNPTKTGHLISKYKSWEVLFEFFNSIESSEEKKIIQKMFTTTFMALNQQKQSQWEPFQRVIDNIAKFEQDPNAPASFKEFIEAQDNFVKGMIVDAKFIREDHGVKVTNPLFILYGMMGSDIVINNLERFQTKKGKEMEIYYNTIIESTKTFKEGEKIGKLNSIYNQYYTMNYAIEPNKILIDMDNIRTKEKEKEKEKKKRIDDTFLPIRTLMLDIGDDTHMINIGLEETNDIVIKIDQDVVKEGESLINNMHNYATYTIESEEWEVFQWEEGLDEDIYKDLNGELVKLDQDLNPISLKEILNIIYDSSSYQETDSKTEEGYTVFAPINLRVQDINISPTLEKKTKCNWRK